VSLTPKAPVLLPFSPTCYAIGSSELTFRYDSNVTSPSGVPRNFVRGGSTNSEDGVHRERGSGGGSPLVKGSAQFANE
jgi:hypothetical protein